MKFKKTSLKYTLLAASVAVFGISAIRAGDGQVQNQFASQSIQYQPAIALYAPYNLGQTNDGPQYVTARGNGVLISSKQREARFRKNR